MKLYRFIDSEGRELFLSEEAIVGIREPFEYESAAALDGHHTIILNVWGHCVVRGTLAETLVKLGYIHDKETHSA